MPLFLKNISPELDIFGNRQLLNFNKDTSLGESDSALTLINWFTPISGVKSNSTLEFLTPTLKGFRFNHSLSTTGTFGSFNFEKYDRFGLSVPLWGYDEVLDQLNFYKPITNVPVTLTGAVTGSGTSPVDTVLSNSQNITADNFDFHWTSPIGGKNFNHLLESSAAGINFNIAIDNGFPNPSEKWSQFFSPTSRQYALTCFSPNFPSGSPFGNNSVTPLSIIIDSVGNSEIDFIGKINLNNNNIINVADAFNSYDAVNKNQLDSRTSWYSQDAGNYTTFHTGIGINGNFSRFGGYGFLNSVGATGATIAGSGNYSLECADRIKASEFNAYSSIKKKTILSNNNDSIEREAIELLRQVPIVKYEYKDKIKEGDAISYGVIAESLNEILPDYVDMRSYDFVPNIMQQCKIKKTNHNTYKIDFKSKDFEIDIDTKKLKLITQDKTVDVDIINIDKKRIKILTEEALGEEVFVYGTYETCPTVAKQKLFELSIAVVQNLLKRVEILEQKGVEV
jgi:hypothetical protein